VQQPVEQPVEQPVWKAAAAKKKKKRRSWKAGSDDDDSYDDSDESFEPEKKKPKKKKQKPPLTFNGIPEVRTTFVWKVLTDTWQEVPEDWQDKLNTAYDAYSKDGSPSAVEGLDAQIYGGGGTYRVNFDDMVQVREDDPSKCRKITKEAVVVESSKRQRELRDAKKCVVCEDAITGNVILEHAGGKACRNEMCEACARPGAFCTRCTKEVTAVHVDGVQQQPDEQQEECMLCCCRGVPMVAFPCDPQTKICMKCLDKSSCKTERCVKCQKYDCWMD
jgi:hypothetical protein